MLGLIFSRTPSHDASDCSGLEPDPEWDELVSWAGIGPKSGPASSASSQSDDGPSAEQAAAAEALPAAEPAPSAQPDASAEQAEWAALIARAKTAEEPIDDITKMRARLEKVAADRLARWEADATADEWDLAIRRAKQL